MKAPQKRARFMYITGCDGTGKTTLAETLTKRLRGEGLPVRRLWLRFPFFFSLPLLAYARWRGFSWYEEVEGVRYGYWDFRRSWLMRAAFPWVWLADAALASLIKIHLPLLLGQTIVCERFALDMLADLAVACGDTALFTRPIGRAFMCLLPRSARVIVLDLAAETICARRPSLKHDRSLGRRLAAYRALAQAGRFALVYNQRSAEETTEEIYSTLSSTPHPLQPRPILPQSPAVQKPPHYGKFRSPLLQFLYRFPPAAVASHWLFQSLLYMDAAERGFKLGLDFLLTLTGLAVLRLSGFGWGTAAGAAFLTAHTLNFLFNGHLWGVLKQYGWVYQSYEDFRSYAQQLAERARRQSALLQVFAFGSFSRGEWQGHSDLDVRLVRRPGFLNGLRACWFALQERSRALLTGFPLDLYVVKNPDYLKKLDPRENAIDLLNSEW